VLAAIALWAVSSALVAAQGPDVLRPDLLIRNVGSAGEVGDGVYGTDGAAQAVSQLVGPGFKVGYVLTVQNDGNTDDTYTIAGPPKSSDRWSVNYYDAESGGTNISSLVQQGGWTTRTIAAGDSLSFRVEISADPANLGQTKTVNVAATSGKDPTQLDVVAATADCQVVIQTDVMVKVNTAADFLGDNLYNSDGAGQTASSTVPMGAKATYFMTIQNDGTAPDSLIVTGTVGAGLWRVQYFSTTGT
jgi:hypothetical protein